MALTALVDIEGLAGDLTPSAMPRYTPGGFADGGRQLLQWQMELYALDSTTPLAAESGTLFRYWDPQVGLDPSRVYRIQVRVQDSGWNWSEWVSKIFRTSFDNPKPPRVLVHESSHGGVPCISVTAIFPADFIGNRRTVLIQRKDPIYGWVNDAERILAQPMQKWQEPEGPNLTPELQVEHLSFSAPSGGETQFRVRGSIQPESVVIAGGWGYSLPISFKEPALGGWLVDPRHPHHSQKVVITSFAAQKAATGATATTLLAPMPSQVIGGTHIHLPAVPMVSKQLFQARAGQFVVRTRTREDHEGLRNLLLGGGTLLLRGHLEKSPDGGRRRGSDLWLKVVGDISEEQWAQHAQERMLLTFDWVEQRPYGLEALREYRAL